MESTIINPVVPNVLTETETPTETPKPKNALEIALDTLETTRTNYIANEATIVAETLAFNEAQRVKRESNHTNGNDALRSLYLKMWAIEHKDDVESFDATTATLTGTLVSATEKLTATLDKALKSVPESLRGLMLETGVERGTETERIALESHLANDPRNAIVVPDAYLMPKQSGNSTTQRAPRVVVNGTGTDGNQISGNGPKPWYPTRIVVRDGATQKDGRTPNTPITPFLKSHPAFKLIDGNPTIVVQARGLGDVRTNLLMELARATSTGTISGESGINRFILDPRWNLESLWGHVNASAPTGTDWTTFERVV